MRGDGAALRLNVEPLKCIGCGSCEAVCSLHRDQILSTMSSSIILHIEDKANYFGLVLKAKEGIVVARPEGAEGQQPSSGGPGAKPIMLREPCDLCGGSTWCVKICPTKAISAVD